MRAKFGEALRRLSTLGFVDLLENDGLKLRSSLMRFAEPVKAKAPRSRLSSGSWRAASSCSVPGTKTKRATGSTPSPAEREPKGPRQRAESEATPLPPAVAEAMADFEEFGAELHTAGAKADAPSETASEERAGRRRAAIRRAIPRG